MLIARHTMTAAMTPPTSVRLIADVPLVSSSVELEDDSTIAVTVLADSPAADADTGKEFNDRGIGVVSKRVLWNGHSQKRE